MPFRPPPQKITNRSRRYTVPHGLLLRNTRLLDHFVDDVVFISIDFEGEDNFFDEPGIIRPVSLGISVLDTRDLSMRRFDIISTQNLCFMSIRQFKDTNSHFLFGESEQLPYVTTKVVLRSKLISLLSQEDPQNEGVPRKAVLVTFDARGETCIIEHLGIRLADYPNLVGIVDIQEKTKKLLGLPLCIRHKDDMWSFMGALEACDVSFGNLHVGGNDAYFNLQLLLSLALIECEVQSSSFTEKEQRTFSIIQNLSANAPQVDRSTTPACFEYRGDMNWERHTFSNRALKYIKDSLPEVQEARRKNCQEKMERRIALKAELKENNEDWHDNCDGIEGFSEVFDGFSSE